MKYRALDANGEPVFGSGLASFLVDSQQAVAQAIVSKLRLLLGEWFLDTTDGTDWAGSVLGKYTDGTRDLLIRERILQVPGTKSIDRYSSYVDKATRTFFVYATVSTIYGSLPFEQGFQQ